MNKEVHFVNKIVKQGNSLCVRMPSSIIKEGKLEEGMEVVMSVVPRKLEYGYDSKTIEKLIKISNKVSKLDKYTKIQKTLFLVLNFEYLKHTQEKKDKIDEFDKILKESFGVAFARKFYEFETTFNKEAFITEDDGTTILKPEYR
ncbi:hypothetical protein JW930_05085 [Candidatus Woesearchaeota archaeon]|nr:hypothetical protein [Candidatus Woesearchaeota archaeon]